MSWKKITSTFSILVKKGNKNKHFTKYILFCVLQKTESLADRERQIWNMHSQVFVA